MVVTAKTDSKTVAAPDVPRLHVMVIAAVTVAVVARLLLLDDAGNAPALLARHNALSLSLGWLSSTATSFHTAPLSMNTPREAHSDST